MKKIVLTGGPGVGKSSILNCLQTRGHEVREEVFTELFAVAQKNGQFSEAFLHSRELIRDLVNAQKGLEARPARGELLFLDRSRVDILGFAKNMGTSPSIDELAWLEKNEYDLLFLVEPLPEKFYDRNSIRRQSQKESLQHHSLIIQHYLEFLKFNHLDPSVYFIKVPYFEEDMEESIKKRTDFILETVRSS